MKTAHLALPRSLAYTRTASLTREHNLNDFDSNLGFVKGITVRKFGKRDKRRISHVRVHLCTLSTRRSRGRTICLLLFSQTGL